MDTEKPKQKTRNKYTPEFKVQAVAHVHRHGGDATKAAAELGINYWTLRDWLEAARAPGQPAVPATVEGLRTENARLKAELERVTEQRDILKKSLGILSTL
jgi:transposase